jgi:hypothetical protein
MAKKEISYKANDTNLITLVSRVAGFGNTYTPAEPEIELTNLQGWVVDAKKIAGDVSNMKAVIKTKTDERFITFQPLRPFATRIVNAFEVSEKDPERIASVRAINRKLQGSRLKGPDEEKTLGADNADDGRSLTQQACDDKVVFFRDLVSLVKLSGKYKPKETELKIANLDVVLADLETANEAVINATTDIENMRQKRDLFHRAPTDSVYTIARSVKKYTKSRYGARSAEYKQISGLRFLAPVKPRKKKKPDA